VSTIHIKHLVDMAPHPLWGEEFLQGVELFQPEHAMISLHYATTEPPKYPLPTGGTISPWKQKPSLLGAPENGAEKGDIFMSYLYVKWNRFALWSARRRSGH